MQIAENPYWIPQYWLDKVVMAKEIGEMAEKLSQWT
jgi:hypothetical protein